MDKLPNRDGINRMARRALGAAALGVVAVRGLAGDVVVAGGAEPAEVLYELPPPPVPYETDPVPTPQYNPGAPVVVARGASVDLSLLSLSAAASAQGPAPLPAAQAAPLDRGEVDRIIAAAARHQPRNATLETMLYDQLRDALPAGSEGFLIERATMPQNLDLPAGGWTVRYDFRMPNRGLGQAAYQAQVLDTSGAVLKRFNGSVHIDREARGLQVTRMVRKGETIQPADVAELGTRLSELPRGAMVDSSALVGNVARVELRPGAWLTDNMVQLPKVVQRGQAVAMRLSRGALKITAPAVTRAAGSIGEVIEVRNAQSGKDLYARVVSKDEVEVIF